MRRLIVATFLCLTSAPAFACVFDTDCNPGATCGDSVCSDKRWPSGDEDDKGPTKNETPKGAKSCFDNSDCGQGSNCVKGSGSKGVCIGH